MKKFYKFTTILVTLFVVLAMTACGNVNENVDYTDAESFEAALNNGDNLEGKVVTFVAGEFHPDSALGYNVYAGEHLNFVSAKNPDIKEGDIVTVKATEITNLMGSWIIKYEKISTKSGEDSVTEGAEDENSSLAEQTESSITEKKKIETYTTEKSNETEAASDSNDLSDIITSEINKTAEALTAEYESLKTEVDDYEKFLSSTDKIEEFYASVYNANHDLCIMLCEYSLDYAEMTVNSDMSSDEKYDELEELYDSIYDDGGEEIYDVIYDGVLEDVYDDFYDGLLDDAYDDEKYSDYSEWSDARSEEYKRWSSTRSDVYKDWTGIRSDIYKFISDIRSEIWDDDIKRANKKIDDFREDVEDLKADTKISAYDAETSASENTEEKTSELSSDENAVAANIIRPEFKEMMDSYEAFFDEYIEFMEKYSQSDGTDMTLMMNYLDYMTKYTEYMDKMNALDESEMTDAEALYYAEVILRVNQKLLSVAY